MTPDRPFARTAPTAPTAPRPPSGGDRRPSFAELLDDIPWAHLPEETPSPLQPATLWFQDFPWDGVEEG